MSSNRAHTSIAPARVNLIGEHTDYTGGLVLPMAIPFYTKATIEPANDGLYTFTSDQFKAGRTLSPGDDLRPVHDWTDYSVGVLHELRRLGHSPSPFTLRLNGNVPLGSGLSSSASVEVSTAFALLSHMQVKLPATEIALLCQRAENNFVGAPSGIMDQTVITLAEQDHALLLHTRDLRTENVPMDRGDFADISVVICNSHVKHSIAAGEYGQRRRQVEEGQAAIIKAHPRLRDLGDATEADLNSVRDRISPEAYKRCRHIITENARVRAMREFLEAGDAKKAGELMLIAHASERDDFACSTEEIDFLVDTAMTLPGCYGARLTGGGFGGCTVNLVQNSHIESFTSALKTEYTKALGLIAETFVTKPVDGALRLNTEASRA